MELRSTEVTVGLPVYNGERFLRATLDSVLAQDHPPQRIVISDNCSRDGTEAICREFASAHACITYLRQPSNVGAIRNFEIVLEACETEFFAWVGDHDLWSPNYLSTLTAAMRADPTCVLAYPEVTRIDTEGAVIEAHCSPDRWSTRSDDAGERLRTLLWQRKTAFMIYGLARARALRQVHARRMLGPDNILLSELVLHGNFAFTPAATFFYRELRDAESVDEMWERQRTALKVHGSSRPLWGVFAETLRLVLRTPLLSWRQKLRALDETVWAFEMRSHGALRDESAARARTLHGVNWLFARFRGQRAPSW